MNAFVAVLKKYLSGTETGQLVVQFAGVENLCKISIENGQAVYLSLGTLSPAQTLEFIAGKSPRKAKFIPGVTARKKLEIPVNENLLAIAAQDHADPGAPPPLADTSATVPAQAIAAAIDDFIDIVGPLGAILAQRALTNLGCSKDTDLPGQLFAAFLQALHAEIPTAQQQAFLDRHQL